MSRYSRFADTILIQDGAKLRNGLRDTLDSTPWYDDLYHIVRQFDRIDLIALHYYGAVDLWWVIADYNGLRFPLVLEEGITLRLPSPQHLFQDLLEG